MYHFKKYRPPIGSPLPPLHGVRSMAAAVVRSSSTRVVLPLRKGPEGGKGWGLVENEQQKTSASFMSSTTPVRI